VDRIIYEDNRYRGDSKSLDMSPLAVSPDSVRTYSDRGESATTIQCLRPE